MCEYTNLIMDKSITYRAALDALTALSNVLFLYFSGPYTSGCNVHENKRFKTNSSALAQGHDRILVNFLEG